MKIENVIQGMLSECFFKGIAKHNGWDVKPSTANQNMRDHIDFFIIKDNETFTVDVKSIKKAQKDDQNLLTDWTWIEIINPIGRVGWAFGNVDMIAFEQPNDFVLIKLEDIQEILNTKVKSTKELEKMIKNGYIKQKGEWVSSPQMARYKFYCRQGKKEILTMVEFKLIREKAFMVWSK